MKIDYGKLLTFAAYLSALLVAPTILFLAYVMIGDLAGLAVQLQNWQADYWQAFGLAVLFFVSFAFWPVSPEERNALMLLWIVRVSVALGVMLGYEVFYRLLDAKKYYWDTVFVQDLGDWIMFGEGTETITGLTAIFRGWVEGYHSVKLIYAYIGHIAVFLHYRAATIVIGRKVVPLLYLLGLFPSIVFWSSLIGKDPIVLLGIGLFCYGAVRFFMRAEAIGVVFLLLGVFIASGIRVWLGPILLAPLAATIVLTGRFALPMKIGFVALTAPVFLFAMSVVAERFAISTAEDLVHTTDEISQHWARGGSGQVIEGGFSSITDMILFIPVGSFTALFRPLPGEVLNPFGMLAGTENALLLLLVLIGLWRNGFRWLREPVLLWAAMTLACWAAIYGFASYQNLGTAFRFRLQVGPLLLLLATFLVFWPRLLDRPGGAGPPDEGDEQDEPLRQAA